MKRKFWFMFTHFYKKQVFTKTFLITNVVLCLFIGAAAHLDVIAGLFSSEKEPVIVYVDDQTNSFNSLAEGIEPMLDAVGYELILGIDGYDENENNILVNIKASETNMYHVQYVSREEVSGILISIINETMNSYKVMQLTESMGIDLEQLSMLNNGIEHDVLNLTRDGEEELVEAALSGVIQFLTLSVYMVVLLYSTMVSSSIIQEKVSKTTLLIMSSVSPQAHMWAKILSVFALFLTQSAILIAFGLGIIIYRMATSDFGKVIEAISGIDMGVLGFENGVTVAEAIKLVFSNTTFWTNIMIIVVFIVISILLLLIVSAILGSIASSMEDASYTQLPTIMVLVVCYVSSTFLLTMGATSWIRIISFIPVASVIYMPISILMGIATTFDIVISLLLLIATTAGVSISSGSIYKRGVLNFTSEKISKQFKRVILGK